MSGAGWVFPLIHNPYGLTLEKHTDLFGMMCLIHFTDNERNCSEAEWTCACVSMSATYVHFTLVNHIEVVSFIAWGGREEEKWKFVREGEKKKIPGFEPTGKLILPVASTSSLSSQRWIFKTIKPKWGTTLWIKRLKWSVKQLAHCFFFFFRWRTIIQWEPVGIWISWDLDIKETWTHTFSDSLLCILLLSLQ